MTETASAALLRDCEAVQIPVGNTVVLPAGTPVEVSQTLGGSLTVFAMG
ncbi:MAG TPA: putative Fe-S cluster assembly protein SufT, partial [Verrucomicrobiota bacterium]|nr:putative Fe-S cluster assembly protein SufT [Verrucomicrobiota bacterium]